MRKKIMTTDFSKIVRGCLYGTNSQKIYKKFCDTLNWDKSKINKFGRQRPLYAENADGERINDVWFIFYPNYDLNKIESSVEDCHVVNFIQKNGEYIIEIIDDSFGEANNTNRITFVKTVYGYEFMGVYKLVKNGTTRIYKRIADTFPIK